VPNRTWGHHRRTREGYLDGVEAAATVDGTEASPTNCGSTCVTVAVRPPTIGREYDALNGRLEAFALSARQAAAPGIDYWGGGRFQQRSRRAS